MVTNVHLGAHVVQADGTTIGYVKYLIAQPGTNQITHAVIETESDPTRLVVAEMNLIEGIAGDGKSVDTGITLEQLNHLPDFMEREFVTLGVDQPYTQGGPDAPITTENSDYFYPVGASQYSADVITAPATTSTLGDGIVDNMVGPVGAPYTETLHVPEGSLIIREGANVDALDGQVGQVKQVNFDTETGVISSFVVEKGFFFTQDVIIPASMVDTADTDHVMLKVTKADTKHLTADELAEQV